jgi:hypothetical protein
MVKFGSDEWMKAVRGLGVKRACYHQDGRLAEIEFFEPPTSPQFGSLDLDTIIPPAPASDTERPPAPPKLAPALSRVLKRGSVS